MLSPRCAQCIYCSPPPSSPPEFSSHPPPPRLRLLFISHLRNSSSHLVPVVPPLPFLFLTCPSSAWFSQSFLEQYLNQKKQEKRNCSLYLSVQKMVYMICQVHTLIAFDAQEQLVCFHIWQWTHPFSICKQQITDEGLITICRGCHRLQSLCVSGCANITDAILHALGQNCPRLRWIYTHPHFKLNCAVHHFIDPAKVDSLFQSVWIWFLRSFSDCYYESLSTYLILWCNFT